MATFAKTLVLACDVGFGSTGWCLFIDGLPSECGCIKTKRNSLNLPKSRFKLAPDYALRAAKLANEFDEIIKKFEPELIVGELPTGGAQSAEAAKQMAMAIAIVASIAALNEKEAIWTTPTQGKKALTGKASADKDEMMDAVRRLYPDFQWPKYKTQFEHIADAVASFICLLKKGEV